MRRRIRTVWDFWDLFATPNTQWRTAQSQVHVVEIMVASPLMWWAYLRQGRNATPAQREAYLCRNTCALPHSCAIIILLSMWALKPFMAQDIWRA